MYVMGILMDVKRLPYTFYLDPELKAGLAAVYERDGVTVSEQIRRAIRTWLDAKGLKPRKPKRKGGR